MFREAIIIAGGKGTRLREVVQDRPKPMALVNDQPFLSYLLDFVEKASVRRVILATGYLGHMIHDYFGSAYKGVELLYSTEDSPLGTGGALARALEQCRANEILVLNGDSYFDIDLQAFFEKFIELRPVIHLATREIQDVSRYGSVQTNDEHEITGFNEKGKAGPGKINAGIYAVDKERILRAFPAGPFSLENDFLAKADDDVLKTAQVFEGNFIDIGTPESLELAKILLRDLPGDNPKIDQC